MAKCPVHDDNEASLHVTYVPGNDGSVLLKCFGCGADVADIASALGLRLADLFDNPLPKNPKRKDRSTFERKIGKRRGRLGRLPALLATKKDQDTPTQPQEDLAWKTTATYDYATPDGEVIQQVIRKEATTASGKTKKTFHQAYFTNKGKTNRKPNNFKPTWYRAPELVDALEDELPIWICEGEKDVHSAEKIGLVAITNAGGAGSLSSEMLRLLHGATLNAVLDRDTAGYKRGIQLLDELADKATLRLYLPATLEEKSDLTDHLNAGYKLSDLVEVTREELETWIEYGRLEFLTKRIEEAHTECVARLEAAQEKQEKAPKTAESHKNKAARWAQEAEARFYKLNECVTDIRRYASVADTEWAKEAEEKALQARSKALGVARKCYSLTGLELPHTLTLDTEKASPYLADTPKEPSEIKGAHGEEAAGAVEPAPTLPANARETAKGPIRYPADSAIPIVTEYAVVDGAICKVDRKPKHDPDEGYKELITFKQVLNLDAHIVAIESNEELSDKDFLDKSNGYEAFQPFLLDSMPYEIKPLVGIRRYVLKYTHPETGEEVLQAVSADDAITCKWLDKLDFPVDFAHTSSGKAEVWRSILAVSKNSYTSRTVYQHTGWRYSKDGWKYVHAGGVITKNGHEFAPTDLTGPTKRYNLPAPAVNAEELKQAFAEIQKMDAAIPSRILLPLIGHTFRSIIGHNPMVAMLVGIPGTLKSSISSWAMSFFGADWVRNNPSLSLAGTGSTLNAARITMSQAKDALYWCDDAAPDLGYSTAHRMLVQFVRMIAERIGRDRAERDGGGVLASAKPNCSGLMTSEFAPEAGSAQQRSFPIALHRGDISVDVMREQSSDQARYHRSLLTASFIKWLAEKNPAQIRRQADLDADAYQHYLLETYLDPRSDERPSLAISQMWIGCKLFFQFLQESQVITPTEEKAWMEKTHQALFDAWQETVDPDIPVSTSARVLDMLRYALHSGIGYLANANNGQAPEFPLAARLGWKRIGDSHDGAARGEARGINMGWISTSYTHGQEDEIYLEPSALGHVLSQVKSAMNSSFEVDEATVKRVLFNDGILLTDTATAGKAHKMTKVRQVEAIGARKRVLVIPLSKFFPSDDEPDAGNEALTNTPPAPPAPAMGDQSPAPAPQAPAPKPQAPQAPQTPAPSHVAVAAPPAPEVKSQPVTPAPIVKKAPAPAASSASTQFAGPAAVMDADFIYTPNGKKHELPKIEHAGQLAELVPALRIGFAKGKATEIGQLWITHEAALKLGLPVDELGDDESELRKNLAEKTINHPLITKAIESGYRIGGKGDRLSSWTRIFRGADSKPIAMLVLMSALGSSYPVINTDPAPSPEEIVERLTLTAESLGMPLLMSPGQTGIDLAIKLRKGTRGLKEMFDAHDPVEPAEISNTEKDFAWTRKPTEEEKELRYLHAYDRGGSYMAGAASLDLGIGKPEHHPRGREFDKKLPGYWLIDIPTKDQMIFPHLKGGDNLISPEQAAKFPHPLAPGGLFLPGNAVWVTTPTLALAEEMGMKPEVIEAYVWPVHSRVLDPFYNSIRLGRNNLIERLDSLKEIHDENELVDYENTQAALDAVKAVYTRTIGMMGSTQYMKGRRGFAPERRHHIIAKSRASILRLILKNATDTGIYPVAVATDTICYLSDNPDPIAAWPGDKTKLGRGFGQYKHEGSNLLSEQIEFLNGDIWRGKDHLIRAPYWKNGANADA
ncbi:hypothetical protein ACUH92_08950 [Dermabacteraceae bacterium CCM 9520]